MRRLFLFTGIIAAASGISWALKAQQKTPFSSGSFKIGVPPVKLYKLELTIEDWSARINQLEYIKIILRQSDLPAKEVALITDSVLIPFQTQITNQINQQLALEKASQLKKDTTKPKK